MNISVRVQDEDGEGSTLYTFQLYPSADGDGLRGESPKGHIKVYVTFDVCDGCGKAKPDVHRVNNSQSQEFFNICIQCEQEPDDDHGLEPPVRYKE
jgi:hypothetical protein